MDVLDGPDVEPARWLRGNDEADRDRELTSDDDFLLVAAGEGPGVGIDRRRPDIKVLDALGGPLADCLEIEDPVLAVRGLVVAVENVVFGHGHRADEPVAAAVLGDVRDADVGHPARAGLLDVLAGDGGFARVDRSQPGNRLDELGLAIALDAGDDHDLARPDIEVDSLDHHLVAIVADLQVANAQDDLAWLRLALGHDQLDIAPDHEVRELLARGRLRVRRAGDAAATEHDDVVGDLQDLVELVGDEDDRRARRRERANDPEQLLGLVWRQNRARLVQDEDVAVPVEGLQDLHPLAYTDGEILDLRVRIDVQLVLLGELDDPLSRRTPIERAEGPAHGLCAECHGLDHVEDRHEHEVLVDHADAGLDGAHGIVEDAFLAIDEDLAGIGLVQARQDVHERRLAGAVLAEQAEHLATVCLDRDLVVCEHAGKPFRDVAQLKPHGCLEEVADAWGMQTAPGPRCGPGAVDYWSGLARAS